ncbi:MAG: beta-N-acetylhexosaminidase [Fibrobacteres bacterium]|nr:beta-N-acetylhexosaminidase [Fibrobacterota bacterium]
MIKIQVSKETVPKELHKGLELLLSQGYVSFSKHAVKVTFVKKGNGLSITPDNKSILVNYEKPCHAFRALGTILGHLKTGTPLSSICENEYFSLSNVMIDMSRNAVMTIPALKEWLAHMALMGLNSLMLYTETTYEIPGEPYFGYNLGRYTQKELRELDDYAFALGIEVIPCIQTLAHLKRLLCNSTYAKAKDTETVLMIDAPETYSIIEKMVKASTAPLRSKRIHIGMDEAWDVGLGNYLKQNGYKSGHDLVAHHLKKVRKQVISMGLKPIMWGDMYFRSASKTGEYYDDKVVIPERIRKTVPKDVQLVYWDYYHFDKSFYKSFLKKHQELNSDIIMAPGLQTWNRLWTNYPYAIQTMEPALCAAKEEGIKEIIMTMWGDDGNECDYFSALPMMQYYAEHVYNDKVDNSKFIINLNGSCDVDYKAWEVSGTLDTPPFAEYPKSNLSKALLWEDPVLGLFQPQLEGRSMNGYYASIAARLKRTLLKDKGNLDARLQLPYQICKVLSLKADFPTRLKKAYDRNNKNALKKILQKDIPQLKKDVTALWKTHQRSWMSIYKVQGWDVLERRYGGLLIRLDSLEVRLKDYLSGNINVMVELEEKRLKLFPSFKKGNLPNITYTNISSFSPAPIN